MGTRGIWDRHIIARLLKNLDPKLHSTECPVPHMTTSTFYNLNMALPCPFSSFASFKVASEKRTSQGICAMLTIYLHGYLVHVTKSVVLHGDAGNTLAFHGCRCLALKTLVVVSNGRRSVVPVYHSVYIWAIESKLANLTQKTSPLSASSCHDSKIRYRIPSR